MLDSPGGQQHSPAFGIVEGWDYEVEAALTGQEALALFAARQPDIVIVDLAFPDVDGCEVIRRTKAVAPGTFVIAHSGVPRTRRARSGGRRRCVHPQAGFGRP